MDSKRWRNMDIERERKKREKKCLIIMLEKCRLDTDHTD